jgi:hypothetical protein
LSCPKLIQQIQEVCGNVIFGDTVSGNPKQMRFGELDCSVGRSDSQQVCGVSSTPGPSNGNPHSIVDQLLDVVRNAGQRCAVVHSRLAKVANSSGLLFQFLPGFRQIRQDVVLHFSSDAAAKKAAEETAQTVLCFISPSCKKPSSPFRLK